MEAYSGSMTSSGVSASAHGLGSRDHLCWAYRQPDELSEGVVTFLRLGLAVGQRALYLAQRPAPQLRRELAGLDGLDDLIHSGALEVRPLADQHDEDGHVDADGQLGAYGQATESAVASGFTGLRVAVDATPLVRTPAQREAFGRWELVADRYMIDHPFAALCAYDICAIGDDVADEMACLHPASWGSAPNFRLHASPLADVALSGEVDAFALDMFTLTLERTVPVVPGEDLRVDVRDLTFIDHRGILALARHAHRAGGRSVVLVQPPPVVPSVLELVDAPLVRVEP